MTSRFASRTLLAVLLATTAACSAEAPTASPDVSPSFRRSGETRALPVAGLWDGDVVSSQPNVTQRWTLNLVQRDEKLEGSLTMITRNDAGEFWSTTSLVSGSGISGRTITVRFPIAQNAETKATYVAELSADGKSMTGTYAFSPAPITLVRR